MLRQTTIFELKGINDKKYIFGHDGIHEYWVIADTPQLAVRVARSKFPKGFHSILKTVYSNPKVDYIHPNRVTFGPVNRCRKEKPVNIMVRNLLIEEIKKRVEANA